MNFGTELFVDSCVGQLPIQLVRVQVTSCFYEGWNFNSGNYLFTTDTK